MKIIHICTSLNNGGLENLMVDVANKQLIQGHVVSIIIINDKIENSIIDRIIPKIGVYYLNRKNGSKNIIPIIKLAYWLYKMRNYDVLHCHAAYLGIYLKLLSRIRRVLTIHGLNYEIKPLKYFNKIIAISNVVREDIVSRSLFKPTVIYNGIITSIIKQRFDRNWNEDKCIRIVQVSSLMHEIKGQDILINAMRILIAQNSEINISIDFVGDGKSKNYLVDLSNSLHLSNYINFIGNKPREWVYENLWKYDLFVQASRYEGFGLTVAEAMAAKVPVIASNNDGPAEVLKNGKYGLLFTNNSAEDLAIKILEAIELIKIGKLNKIVDEAYSYCLNNFDIEQTAKKYIEQYTCL